MELLALLLVAIWVAGIGATAYSVVYFVKNGEGELHEKFQLVLDTNPVAVLVVLTVLIVAWPATLAFSIATKRK